MYAVCVCEFSSGQGCYWPTKTGTSVSINRPCSIKGCTDSWRPQSNRMNASHPALGHSMVTPNPDVSSARGGLRR